MCKQNCDCSKKDFNELEERISNIEEIIFEDSNSDIKSIDDTYLIEAQYEKIMILKNKAANFLKKYNECIIEISKEEEVLKIMEG